VLNLIPMNSKAEIVICGAGIAGISAAFHLAVRSGAKDILLIDQAAPFSLTSDKSTECYRNWWPNKAMVGLMNRSIDLLEELAVESGDAFHLSRRGYLYVTAQSSKVPELQKASAEISRLGAGPLRQHGGNAHDTGYQPGQAQGFAGEPTGADLLLDPAIVHRYFPYLTRKAQAALHVRRAGWFSAQQLGAYLLERAVGQGVRLLHDRVIGVETSGGRVQAVRLEGGRVETDRFVAAGGPMLPELGRMLGLQLPVFTELHLKAAFRDISGVIPRQAPLLIWTDAQYLPWSQEEKAFLAQDPETRWLLDEFPPGAHTRPEGGLDSPTLLMLWEYRTHRLDPTFPVPLDAQYPEIVLRGLATMLPGLSAYFDHLSHPNLDGGYYTRTPENLPLIGPLPVSGAYVSGAFSGFGLMAACAAGELLAAHLLGQPLPVYAPAFDLARYHDPHYLAALEMQEDTGQL
jgi:sarcosine oxidase, subunit beta